MNELPINGFAIANFRSFGSDFFHLGPFEKINIIIGANNSGKSNILRFIRNIYPKIVSKQTAGIVLEPGDVPRFSAQPTPYYPVLIAIETAAERLHIPTRANDLRKIVNHYTPNSGSSPDLCWMNLKRQSQRLEPDIDSLTPFLEAEHSDVRAIWQEIQGSTGGGFQLHWLPDVLGAILSTLEAPNIVYIPAFRKIESRLKEYESDYGHDAEKKTKLSSNLQNFHNQNIIIRLKKKNLEK